MICLELIQHLAQEIRCKSCF